MFCISLQRLPPLKLLLPQLSSSIFFLFASAHFTFLLSLCLHASRFPTLVRFYFRVPCLLLLLCIHLSLSLSLVFFSLWLHHSFVFHVCPFPFFSFISVFSIPSLCSSRVASFLPPSHLPVRVRVCVCKRGARCCCRCCWEGKEAQVSWC